MCAERDRRRLGGEHAQRRRERLGLLRREPPLRPAARAAPGPSRKNRSRSPRSRSASQAARLLDPPVLREPPRQLLGRLLRLELGELGLLVREQPARLQLEQRGDEHEELAAGVEVELLALREPLDEREHDPGDVDLASVQLLAQDEGQQQVERALERVEVELELADDSRAGTLTARAGRGPCGIAIAGPFGLAPLAPPAADPPRPRLPAAEELPPDEERGRAARTRRARPRRSGAARRTRATGRSAAAPRRSVRTCRRRRRARTARAA